MANVKSCFVISPIGAGGSDIRKRSDQVLKHIFKAALEPSGYKVVRADEISAPGSITLQVLERVLESDLVIADLTDHNPNVFYELAVRHASGKPVIHVIDTQQKIPFDIADLRAVYCDLDLDGAERAKAAIIAQVKEIEAGHAGETPIRLAGILKHLESGKSEEKVVLRQLLEGMSMLRSEMRMLFDQSSSATRFVNAELLERISSSREQTVSDKVASEVRSQLARVKDRERAMAQALADRALKIVSKKGISFNEAFRIAEKELDEQEGKTK